MEESYVRHIAVSSRVRLARNLAGYPFPRRATDRDAEEIVRLTARAAERAHRDFALLRMNSVEEQEKESMKEKHLISADLAANVRRGAVLLSDDEKLSVMLNEEDSIREQAFGRGFCLKEAFDEVDRLDSDLEKTLEFAYDRELGYLTACPTNLGTGLRASVMLFLPTLTECSAMGDIIREVSRLGLTVRGAMGEGSSAEGYLYQLSNEVTLGATEARILESVSDAAKKICEAEMRTRENQYRRAPLETRDRVLRAYGTLSHCALLGLGEFMRLAAEVKKGVSLGIVTEKTEGALDDFITEMRPACIELLVGERLGERERDEYRARMACERLPRIAEINGGKKK